MLFGLYGGVVGIVEKNSAAPSVLAWLYSVPDTVPTALYVALHGQLSHVVVVFSI